jgi:hypothetical protein
MHRASSSYDDEAGVYTRDLSLASVSLEPFLEMSSGERDGGIIVGFIVLSVKMATGLKEERHHSESVRQLQH